MFEHIHFLQCESTQLYLKSNLESIKQDNQWTHDQFLVSCEQQTEGIGRRGNTWFDFQKALAFSFTLSPNENLEITPLEVGVLVCQFFTEQLKTPLKLKWPNDLLNAENKKCGGLIMHNLGADFGIIVGCGINLLPSEGQKPHQNFDYGFALKDESVLQNISHDPMDHSYKSYLPHALYTYIQQHRLSSEKVQQGFGNLCAHQGFPVTIEDGANRSEGIFEGIGPKGEAIIKIDQKPKRFYSGTLRF